MTLLHLAMPGVPEVYQGAETEYRALVDPDNRRPAHFPRTALARLDAGAAPDGPAEEKLALTAAVLRLRRDRPELFRGYAPVPVRGAAAGHLVAFTRAPGLLVAATRLSHRLAASGGWRDTRLHLPPGKWTPALPSHSRPSPPHPRPSHSGATDVAALLDGRPVGVWLRR